MAGRASLTDKIAIIRATWRYPGWGVVAKAFFIFLIAFGAPLTMPFVYPEVMKEFGWTLTQATLIYTYKSLTGAIMAIFIIGPLVERIGLKLVLVVAMAAEAIGLAGFLFVHSLWSYYVVGFMIGIGQGAVIISLRLLVSRWFMRNVGLATGVAVIGTSFGGVLFPLMTSQLIPLYGWRVAFACLSIGIFCISIPLALSVRFNPSEADVLPEAVRTSEQVSSARLRAADLGISFRTMLRQHAFWLIALATFLSALIDQALFQHSIYYLTNEIGLSRTVAASAWSLTFLIGIGAKFVAGMTFDRFSVKGVAGWNLLLGLAILLALPVQGLFTALVFTTVLGVAHGGLTVDGPVVAKHVYGPSLMNRLLPVLAGFNTMGSAFGPVVLANLYDRNGTYLVGFGVFIGLTIVAALLMARVTPAYLLRIRALQDSGSERATGS
ncbi:MULTISPECIES: MFS transporter [Sphingobium]|uniref:MFS transporter n=1 Tax=Sphingobium TaxID=165695 RepID=UPI0015EC3334|nr:MULTISPECIES: MFS transporter [Sphingobium]MCW2362596.1 MFS family permease [Sphingobium sp. B10D3B]MCW2400724.1 MFS family permease [Sphingobium sp. B10D7B]MCW2407703.1 MFS family permease [Sphingobium xanthum]